MRSTATALVLLVLCSLPAWSSSVTVNWNGSGDYTTIGAAIVYATSTGVDTVRVAQGTYSGEGNTEIIVDTSPLVIEAIDAPDVTIIDGNDEHWAFSFEAGADSTVVVRGLTFSHCYRTSNGGAIQVTGASPTIEDCVFENCATLLNGGAAHFYESSSLLRECVFASNSAGANAGAIYCYRSGITVDRCLFRSNTTMSPYSGGAVYTNTSTDLYTNCTFVDNSYITVGLYYCPSAVVSNCVIFGTTNGAAVANVSGSEDAEITHCIAYANAGGDSLPSHHHDNLFVDPLFCDAGSHDYTVCADSKCLMEHNAWGELVGAYGPGCAACGTAVEESTWGCIKARYR